MKEKYADGITFWQLWQLKIDSCSAGMASVRDRKLKLIEFLLAYELGMRRQLGKNAKNICKINKAVIWEGPRLEQTHYSSDCHSPFY